MHITACVWYYIISQNQIWIPPLDFIEAGNSEIYRFYYPESGVWNRYITSIYYAMLCLGGNEMGPRTDFEVIVMFFILAGYQKFGSFFVGEFTVAIAQGSEKTKFF